MVVKSGRRLTGNGYSGRNGRGERPSALKTPKADAQTAESETRVIVKRDAGWEYAVYHWNEGTQAKKLEPGWAPAALNSTVKTALLSMRPWAPRL